MGTVLWCFSVNLTVLKKSLFVKNQKDVISKIKAEGNFVRQKTWFLQQGEKQMEAESIH